MVRWRWWGWCGGGEVTPDAEDGGGDEERAANRRCPQRRRRRHGEGFGKTLAGIQGGLAHLGPRGAAEEMVGSFRNQNCFFPVEPLVRWT